MNTPSSGGTKGGAAAGATSAAGTIVAPTPGTSYRTMSAPSASSGTPSGGVRQTSAATSVTGPFAVTNTTATSSRASEKKRKAGDDAAAVAEGVQSPRPTKRACPEGSAIVPHTSTQQEAQAPAQVSTAALAARRQADYYANKTRSLSDLAHGLIMDQIFSYLDSRALYRLTCLTAKSLSQFVTTRHVVYSAVASGGNTRESLNRVVGLLKKETVHAPSKFRLLRILNGVACERGAECVQHGIRHRKMMEAAAAAAANKSRSKSKSKAKVQPPKITVPKIKGVQLVRKDFGLFICNDCTAVFNAKKTPSDKDKDKNGAETEAEAEANGSEVPKYATIKMELKGGPGNNNYWFLRHKRLAQRQQNHRYSPVVLRNPFTDSAKELAGPILTHADFLEFKDKGKDADIQKKLKALDDVALQGGFASAAIITYHKEALELFEKRKRARESESKEKRIALYNKRVQGFEKVVKQLEERLGGAAWKSVALSYALQGNAHKYTRSSSVAIFKCPIVQEIMKEFTIVPSNADSNNLSVKAVDIMQSFNAIWSSGFHDLSFLNAPADSGDVLCRDLRDFYKGRLKITPEAILQHERMHPDMLRLIRSGQCLEALYRRFQAENTVHLARTTADGAASPPVWHTEAWYKPTVPRSHSSIGFFIFTAWYKEARNLGRVTQNQAVRTYHDACYVPYKQLSAKSGAEFSQLWRAQHSNALQKVHQALVRANR